MGKEKAWEDLMGSGNVERQIAGVLDVTSNLRSRTKGRKSYKRSSLPTEHGSRKLMVA
jgi:hypothetical protein